MHDIKTFEGTLNNVGGRYALVVARFNSFVVEALLAGAVDTLVRHGVARDDIEIIRVPGAWELPVAVKKILEKRDYDAVIALGAVIRGGTAHFEYVGGEAAKAGVQGHYQLVAGGREQQGRVVAGAQHHAIARRVVRAAEVAFYQSEFIHNQTLPLLCHGQSLSAPSSSGACRDAAGRWAVSAERSRRASLSSTPLTYLKESSAPNTLASSMLSLITTR